MCTQMHVHTREIPKSAKSTQTRKTALHTTSKLSTIKLGMNSLHPGPILPLLDWNGSADGNSLQMFVHHHLQSVLLCFHYHVVSFHVDMKWRWLKRIFEAKFPNTKFLSEGQT
jgi:hypothetical protein